MVYDAIASAPASIPRDLGKKKRGNRTAKLKQCKLDARREQWLSQVNKEANGSRPITMTVPPNPPLPQSNKKRSKKREDREREREQRNESVFLHEMSDSDSPSLSPNSNPSNDGRPISSGSSSVGSSSQSISDPDELETTNPRLEEEDLEEDELEEGENDVLDDWEAVADALTSQTVQLSNQTLTLTEPPNPKPSKQTEPVRAAPRAWRPDDAFRPQSLPSISKQMSFCSASIDRHFDPQKGILSMPSSCPICYEDLDSTDSSFLPCPCGFRLCLFCHKRILEADGKCPGCRKKYEADPVEKGSVNPQLWANRLSRSCSLNARY
ncbi:hypothetical protein LUZ60_003177 [Juncus effusus]|nr:hypothetical protein LUZ60_003177 [Juncus effusus]